MIYDNLSIYLSNFNKFLPWANNIAATTTYNNVNACLCASHLYLAIYANNGMITNTCNKLSCFSVNSNIYVYILVIYIYFIGGQNIEIMIKYMHSLLCNSVYYSNSALQNLISILKATPSSDNDIQIIVNCTSGDVYKLILSLFR